MAQTELRNKLTPAQIHYMGDSLQRCEFLIGRLAASRYRKRHKNRRHAPDPFLAAPDPNFYTEHGGVNVALDIADVLRAQADGVLPVYDLDTHRLNKAEDTIQAEDELVWRLVQTITFDHWDVCAALALNMEDFDEAAKHAKLMDNRYRAIKKAKLGGQ